MPLKKKKLFTKENSVKFLLLHGNSEAVNADGETLQNVFVPVGKNYKAGTSLLMSNISSLCEREETSDGRSEADLEKIMGQFEDSDVEELQSGMQQLAVKHKQKRFDIEEGCSDSDDFFEAENEFSDGSEEYFDEQHDVMPDKNCLENIKLLNARFEKVLEEYDEDQIGALDDEDIGGNLSTDCERVQSLFQSEFGHEEGLITIEPCDETIKEKILNYVEESEEENIVEIITKKPLEFDCESILSTYSNIYNHPTVIKEEKVKKAGTAKNPLKKGLTKSQVKALDHENEIDKESEDNFSDTSRFNVRSKRETLEEKRERKALFKEAKRESRILKKENKLAFKKEKKMQAAQALNAQHIKGIKLM